MFGLDTPEEPAAFAVRADDLDVAVERARAAGHDPGDVEPWSRARPDWTVLRWRLAKTEGIRPDPVPFLVGWGTRPSPDWAACPPWNRCPCVPSTPTRPGPSGSSRRWWSASVPSLCRKRFWRGRAVGSSSVRGAGQALCTTVCPGPPTGPGSGSRRIRGRGGGQRSGRSGRSEAAGGGVTPRAGGPAGTRRSG
ncbi:VOC family protein [Nocardiopsis sp. CNT312]|uniref:VOC family protein n=1 Tax=Nocardiopsis sp. CNT312 TaxID=1137268 RepID=UPI0004AD4916|nr:VOC family protein [Nocardiopsis sp. CNT312]